MAYWTEIIFKSQLKQRLEMMIDKYRVQNNQYNKDYFDGYIKALTDVIKEFCV